MYCIYILALLGRHAKATSRNKHLVEMQSRWRLGKIRLSRSELHPCERTNKYDALSRMALRMMTSDAMPLAFLVREEILMARDTLTGPAPMDVSAFYKGKGKGKGKRKKGKGKNMEKEKQIPAANPDAEMIR